jgi:Tfp pilus assembly protein FimV
MNLNHNMNHSISHHNYPLRAVMGGLAASIALTSVVAANADRIQGAVHSINEAITHPPAFSDDIFTETVREGETVWDLAGQVKDPNDHATRQEIVNYIVHMPANSSVFEDGASLDSGETVVLPESVK